MMDNFLSLYSLNSDVSLEKWKKLDHKIKNNFIDFLKNNNMI
jgi:hypothetical protein